MRMDLDLSYDEYFDDVDLEIDIEMPETPVPPRSARPLPGGGQQTGLRKTPSKLSLNAPDTGKKRGVVTKDNDKENVPSYRYSPFPDAAEASDPEEKLLKLSRTLKDCLQEVSRQRLRALHMALRRFGNLDSRISEKDMMQVFQDNQIVLTPRLHQMINDLFADSHGIDYEKLYRCFLSAHDLTGRDSVKGRKARNDVAPRAPVPQEVRDADFVHRLEEQLVRDRAFFDIDSLRHDFQALDSNRSGEISKETALMTCKEKSPLYGALLQNLLKRCSEGSNDKVSWPTLLSFLEKAQANAQARFPELVSLAEKAKETAAVNIAPDPIDELSSVAKSRVMSKLRKKPKVRQDSVSPTPSTTQSVSTLDTPRDAIETEPRTDVPTDAGQTTPENDKGKMPDDRQVTAETEKKANKPVGKRRDKKSEGVSKIPPVLEEGRPSDGGSEAQTEKAARASGELTTQLTAPPVTEVSSSPPAVPSRALVSFADLGQGHGDTSSESPSMPAATKPPPLSQKHLKALDIPVDPPNERLQLEWVYGCRGNDCRRNVHVLASGELTYFLSNIVIMLDCTNHVQRHYKEHSEDVKCMAVHKDGVTVATGQFASINRPENKAHIRLWRSDLLLTVHVLGADVFSKAVMCVAFSPHAEFLAAVDNSSPQKILSIWDLRTATKIAENGLESQTVCDMDFNPKHENILVTCGKEHLAWWRVFPDAQRLSVSALPDYEKSLRAKYIVCLSHTDKGDLITGDSNGTVYIWADGGNKITNFIKHGHDGPVLSLLFCRQHLLTGGRDGQLRSWAWSKNMNHANNLMMPACEGGLRYMMVHEDSLVISTTMNSLLSVKMAPRGCPLDKATFDQTPVTQGHFDDVYGVAVIPSSVLKADVLTAGVDGVLCKFSSELRRPVWKLYLKGMEFLCVDCSSTGEHMALGTKDGHVVVLRLQVSDMTVVEVINQKVTADRLDCIKLSPDGKWLAAGSHDTAIYLFRLTSHDDGDVSWEMYSKLKGHGGRVTALDWSHENKNGSFLLRSCSSFSGEQKMWNTLTSIEIPLNDVDLDSFTWATNTCSVDHLLTGVVRSFQGSAPHITAVDVNPSQTLVAVGNNQGSLCLYRYPCVRTGIFCHTYRCHHVVAAVRFSPSGSSILTLGGQDSTLLQWKIV
ncbi:echinoderm microtubule-associated protein-like 2 isoform X3 [Pomacea canaliculata]|uniref:echinoderm microtubule-associated protein-like 2 isoform X3 n=1 Tax=Pomacea canaliculata TaxID=400727 RepID=UPI000D732DCC|nr:echinoderm microtubule-associated protein-like 2 isoform X3 [Pomacea canaliculata]